MAWYNTAPLHDVNVLFLCIDYSQKLKTAYQSSPNANKENENVTLQCVAIATPTYVTFEATMYSRLDNVFNCSPANYTCSRNGDNMKEVRVEYTDRNISCNALTSTNMLTPNISTTLDVLGEDVQGKDELETISLFNVT